ncbi:hypothetical protein BD309DRAFT_1083200 [Dichomitus squalens]|uniref:Uncharacterized protein n=1 Tax=Dichomitus squalens TaxID=114155 RepID=A0A4Q9NH99_9APHY|nr:hypothetical protein BD311DRAFT_795865 [Dichomitus squalens]TBU39777.1 hypothetical protein BD309DRAFT_1083200 [Dichomitus squalens]
MAGIIARAPFDNPAADTVIRSKDGVNFRVRSGIIAEASPIFSDMFGIPLPDPNQLANNSDYMDGKPVVAVEEDSATLDRLLRLCYPTTDPVLTQLGDVRLVLAAAMKYEMEEASALMKKALLSFVKSQPLSVWALACILRLEPEARIAAEALLGKDLPIDAPLELQDISAGTYYRLVKFHRAKGDVGEQFKFTEPGPDDVPRIRRTKPPRAKIVYRSRPFADIICRSSDGQEFQTHKIILCAASSTLQDQILALPTSAEPSSSLPVISLDARGAPLGALLEMSYPVDCDGLSDIPVHDAIAMMDCARRFRMDTHFRRLRYNSFGTLKVSQPLPTYLLASSFGLTEVAEDALAFLHADPFTYGCIPEMETTPALAYHHLLINRRESLAVASKLTAVVKPTSQAVAAGSGDLAADETMDVDASASIGSGSDESPPRGDPWLLGILERTVEELRSPHQDEHWWEKPKTSATLQQSVDKGLWCGDCEDNVRLILRIENLHADVRKAMDANNGKLLKRRLPV